MVNGAVNVKFGLTLNQIVDVVRNENNIQLAIIFSLAA